MKFGPMAAALMCALASAAQAGSLGLHRDRTSPSDLALTGSLAGVPAGEARYVSWAELRGLPTAVLNLDGSS